MLLVSVSFCHGEQWLALKTNNELRIWAAIMVTAKASRWVPHILNIIKR